MEYDIYENGAYVKTVTRPTSIQLDGKTVLGPDDAQLATAGYYRQEFAGLTQEQLDAGISSGGWSRVGVVDGKSRYEPTTVTAEQREATAAAAEAARQAAKPAALKAVENRFLLLCEQLTGSRNKATFGELSAVIHGMLQSGDAATIDAARNASLELLAVDAEAKREGGLRWWDDCTWHEEATQ